MQATTSYAVGQQVSAKSKRRFTAAVKRHYAPPKQTTSYWSWLYENFYWLCRKVQFFLTYDWEGEQRRE